MKKFLLFLLMLSAMVTASPQVIYDGGSSPNIAEENGSNGEEAFIYALAGMGKTTVTALGNFDYRITVTAGGQTLVSDVVSFPYLVNDSWINFPVIDSKGTRKYVMFKPDELNIGGSIKFILLEKDRFPAFSQALKKQLNQPSQIIKGNINLPALCEKPFGFNARNGQAISMKAAREAARHTYGWDIKPFRDGNFIGFSWPKLNGMSLFGCPLSKLSTTDSFVSEYWKAGISGEAIYSTKAEEQKLKSQISSAMLGAGWKQINSGSNGLCFYKGPAIAEFWFIASSAFPGKYECGFQSEIFDSAETVQSRLENGVG